MRQQAGQKQATLSQPWARRASQPTRWASDKGLRWHSVQRPNAAGIARPPVLMRCFCMVLLHLQMRGVTVPGNVEGTVVRNGAAHRRRRGQAAGAAGKGARRGLSVQGGINKR